MGPCGGLGMVLDAEGADAFGGEALARSVVQMNVRALHGIRERLEVDAEAMVLRRDLDATRREVFHRLVAAAVAELELVRLAAEREREELMPEAYSEDRFFADEATHRVDRVADRGGIAGTVREKNSVGREAEHVLRARLRGDDRDAKPGVDETAQDVALDSEVH